MPIKQCGLKRWVSSESTYKFYQFDSDDLTAVACIVSSPDELCSGFFAGSKKIAANAQMPQSAPATVQDFCSGRCTWQSRSRESHRESGPMRRCATMSFGSISDLMKKSPEK